jgi:holo-[acyl-carrier protein] synthase
MLVDSIGVDICDIPRITKIIKHHDHKFLSKVFTNHEIEYCTKKADSYPYYAARFAAKEALLKALGTGLRDGLNWKDIEVNNDSLGKPFFKFCGKTAEKLENRTVLLSLSHGKDSAIAFVVIQS